MANTPGYHIALVDDHQIFTDGFKTFLLQRFADVKAVVAYSNPLELLRNIQAKSADPDIIFMDIDMPEMNGIEATKRVLELNPLIKVIAVTQFRDGHNAEEMFKAGAHGYIPKTCSSAQLEDVFECIRTGEKYLAPEMALTYVKHSIVSASSAKLDAGVIKTKEYSPRMLTVIRGIKDGKTDKEIANLLNVGTKTVEYEKRKIMKKMGVNKATQIVTKAFELGLLL